MLFAQQRLGKESADVAVFLRNRKKLLTLRVFRMSEEVWSGTAEQILVTNLRLPKDEEIIAVDDMTLWTGTGVAELSRFVPQDRVFELFGVAFLLFQKGKVCTQQRRVEEAFEVPGPNNFKERSVLVTASQNVRRQH